MKIWVDADACPVVIKEILFRAALRTKITTTLVANQFFAHLHHLTLKQLPSPAGLMSLTVELYLSLKQAIW